jgi:hypothetical protein
MRSLLVLIALLTHRQLALHQTLHKSVAMGALQIQQRLYGSEAAGTHALSIGRRYRATLNL